jgi:hypothetical protein
MTVSLSSKVKVGEGDTAPSRNIFVDCYTSFFDSFTASNRLFLKPLLTQVVSAVRKLPILFGHNRDVAPPMHEPPRITE